MLHFGDPPPFSIDTFLAICRDQIHTHDMVLLESVVYPDLHVQRVDNAFTRQWRLFLSQVQGQLVEQRAKRLSLSEEQYRNQTHNPFIDQTIQQALDAGTPLEGELILMRLVWRKADELAALHTFDIEYLCAYGIQLGILVRNSLFQPKEGKAEFNRLLSKVRSDIQSR